MGTVYQAVDRESGSLVAIKILHQTSTIETARFEQEARLLAELHHPGIVRYFANGLTAQGQPYIAMEWLEGETLEERMSRGRLGPAAAAQVAACVLDALSAAHARGVVHRDIKPSNVFLVGWKLTNVRLLDFGIARRVYDPHRLTRKGSTVGTPLYTSPEQARGRHDIDGRSDMFSLGCVLYEALTGEPPFAGDSALDVMTRVCEGRYTPITERRSGLPAELVDLLGRMLTANPRNRPASTQALAAEFRALSTQLGDPLEVAAPPPSPIRRDHIGTIEERLMGGVLISLPRRNDEPDTDERRRGPLSAHPQDVGAIETLGGPSERLRRLQDVVEPLGCEIDRLMDRTLLVTAPALATAREQAIQLARAALAVRDLESDARLALATDRAALMARVPVGRLMDELPALLEGQSEGTITIDDLTRRLLPARFVVGASNGRSVLFAEVVRSGLDRPRTLNGRFSPFLGRERDLETLLSVYSEVTEEPVARAVIVQGDPGAGKSRLAREFLASVSESPARVFRCSGSLSRPGDGFPALAPLLAAAGIDGDRRAPTEVERALISWMGEKTSEGPVILVVDDLQWADPVSLRVLDEILRALATRPFLLLGLARPDVDDRYPGLWSGRAVEHLRLQPLARKTGQALLAFWMPQYTAEAERFALDRWEGNPLFIEEISDALQAGRNAVPEVVLATVEARMDSMTSETRRALRAATVFGDGVFSPDALLAVLGEGSRRDLGESLENLVMREFLDRRIEDGETVYQVRSPLVREAAYRMVPDADRVLGRRLAVSWLTNAGRTVPEFLALPGSQTQTIALP
jgi:serine/threonine protein kinase